MTCIVGLVEAGVVWIGADSAGVTDSLNLRIRADRKVFKNGPFLMGFTNSFRMGQLLAHTLRPPKPREDDDVFSFMVNDFINAVRDCLKTGGFASKEHDVETGGCFLVGFRGRLFTIYDDYQVSENLCGYMSVGCGANLAIGSLYSTTGLTPETRLMTALAAAEYFSAGVQSPFHILTTEASSS